MPESKEMSEKQSYWHQAVSQDFGNSTTVYSFCNLEHWWTVPEVAGLRNYSQEQIDNSSRVAPKELHKSLISVKVSVHNSTIKKGLGETVNRNKPASPPLNPSNKQSEGFGVAVSCFGMSLNSVEDFPSMNNLAELKLFCKKEWPKIPDCQMSHCQSSQLLEYSYCCQRWHNQFFGLGSNLHRAR